MTERARAFFEAIARRYDRVYAPDARASRARMDRVLRELAPESDVLDLGIGTGRELPSLLDGGHRPVGVDFSPEMIAICSKRSRPVPLFLADLWSGLPFPDGSFDAAVALHGTLAHPPDDGAYARLARELERVLRPSCVLVAEVPSMGWLERLEHTGPIDESLRTIRTGPDRCVHEDTTVGCSIEARVVGAEGWRRAFAGWDVCVEPMSAVEMLVVARRSAR